MKTTFSPRDIVTSGLCIGCGICVSLSRNTGFESHMKFDVFGQLKPKGPSKWYRKSSELFSEICPFSPSAKNEDSLSSEFFSSVQNKNVSIGHFESNWVGHVLEDHFRELGSSGGMVSWVAIELMRKGLIDGVAHVVATRDPLTERRYFKYRISRNGFEIKEGAKSRYYPVELSEILDIIREVPGRYAVVAVPCMIKAIHLLRQNDSIFRERICFTLGLFCGHMKSARFVESFAFQMKIQLNKVRQVDFRFKHPERPANWYDAKLTLNDDRAVNRDWWRMVDGDWGAGFFMNSACNYCDDVVAETADVSFGDAWIKPYSLDGNGTNVIVARSHQISNIIKEGIDSARLQLQEVSAEFVEQTQAAGLRQRREGLAYRLTWTRFGLKPVKRILPDNGIARNRKVIYRMRYFISKWSHRVFWLSRELKVPSVYLLWARTVAAIYYGIAYHNGIIKEIKRRFSELKMNSV